MTQDLPTQVQSTGEGSPAGRRGLAGVLRTVAGAPAVWRRGRRGSFLVMVVGTLALLSVFAILYVSIGNQDVRAKAAAVHRENLDDVPKQFEDYVSNIIAADRLDVGYDRGAYEAAAAGEAWRLTREAVDAPTIDWNVRSDVPADWSAWGNGDGGRVFTPTGGVNFDAISGLPGKPAAAASSLGVRSMPTDPWLATTLPTALSVNPNAAEPNFAQRRDWAQISTVSPDGRFVNLFNLKNNFRATHDQMRASLSLPGALYYTTVPSNFVERPAYWATAQVGAFRPVTDKASTTAADAAFPSYQWVDADGDGFFDSRIFELREYNDRSAPAEPAKDLLQTDGSIRWFFATRIIDLSGLVNVNTAGDFRAAPSVAAPAGTGGPAEVDLRRLLTLRDAYDTNTVAAGQPGGYDGLFPDPRLAALGSDYTGNYTEGASQIASNTGRLAYTSLRLSLAAGFPMPRLGPGGQVLAGPNFAANAETAFNSTPPSAANTLLSAPEYDWFPTPPVTGMAPELRRRLYGEQAGEVVQGLRGTWMNDPGNNSPVQRVTGAFGLNDELELLTYFGANNDATLSPLEVVLGGRNIQSNNSPNTAFFSPLRDNRGAEAERPGNQPRNWTVPANINAAMLQPASDVRRLLTTVSGATPLRSNTGINPGSLSGLDMTIDAADALERGNARDLFYGYAAALDPFAYVRDSWNASGSVAARWRTTSYGYQGHELALQVAAHMAANMKDLYDYDANWTNTTNPNVTPDTNPVQTVYTLVLNDTVVDKTTLPNTVQLPGIDAGSHPELFPAMSPSAQAPATPRSDYFYLNQGLSTNEFLGDANSTNLTCPVLNVYGIEPQPFITNISTYTVYTDAPDSAGGDDEDTDGRLGATIKRGIVAGNSDFLYRALAIQVTNPFDTPVDLSTGSPGSVTAEYYLSITEGAGTKSYLMGGQADTSLGQIRPIQIPPRSSVVVMILSSDLSAILGHVQAVDPAAAGLTAAGLFKNVIANSMNDGQRRIEGVFWIPTLDPLTGSTSYPGAGVDPIITTNTPRVELWRARTNDRRPTATSTTVGDQLIDRLRMPANAELNRDFPSSTDQNEIAGSDPTDDGYTLTMWASVRRPSDPSAATGTFTPGQFKEPQGAFPAFCMEPKYRDPSNPLQTTWNIADKDSVGATLTDADFLGGAGPAPQGVAAKKQGNRKTMADWRAALTSNLVIPTLGVYPGCVNTNTELFGKTVDEVRVDGADSTSGTSWYTKYPLPTGVTQGEFYARDYPLAASDNRRFRRPSDPASAGSAPVRGLRLADLLLPLAIGPMNAPLNGAGQLYTEANDPGASRRWTTLAEAMAFAMGYDDYSATPLQPAGAPNMDPLAVYAPAVVGSQSVYPLDRGQVRLDQYTPFLDINGNGVRDTANNEPRVGAELPPAMSILNQFDVPMPGERSTTKMTLGKVNVNTAPVAVLRALPMLSPMTGTNPDQASNPANWWWTGSPSLAPTSDLAVTLAAYRDHALLPYRPQSLGTAPVAVFTDMTGTTPAPAAPGSDNAAQVDMNGRSLRTQAGLFSQAGISEWPGLRGVGEVLAANMVDPANSVLPASNTNITFLGRNGSAVTGSPNDDRLGVNSLIFQPTPSQPNTIQTDAVKDDYAELLAAAQGALSTTTARSDVFAVWFMVMGFREGDVVNLSDDDPVVPSIKRRFVMVVDRSNVTRLGDKPKVLLVKELPVEN